MAQEFLGVVKLMMVVPIVCECTFLMNSSSIPGISDTSDNERFRINFGR